MSRTLFFVSKPALRFLGLALLLAGCVQIRQTDPARTATEQLLLSTAADRAVTNTSLSLFANKKVFLDTNYFESYDSKYAIGSIRDALSQAGAILVEGKTNSDIMVEARSGALSTDDRSYLIGIPATGLPIPLVGAFSIPEIAIYKSQKQDSTAKFALLAYDTHSNEHVFSSGSIVGKAHDDYFKIVFFAHHSTDIPEKAKAKKPK